MKQLAMLALVLAIVQAQQQVPAALLPVRIALQFFFEPVGWKKHHWRRCRRTAFHRPTAVQAASRWRLIFRRMPAPALAAEPVSAHVRPLQEREPQVLPPCCRNGLLAKPPWPDSCRRALQQARYSLLPAAQHSGVRQVPLQQVQLGGLPALLPAH